jgi:lipopolysaccharide export system permease protein
LIIDRYLVRQVAMPCFLVAAVLLIIFVGYSLSRFLTQADAGLLNTGEVIRLTLLKALIALEVLLPIALFFGLILGLGTLHNDSEIVAMQASGISESRMIRPVVTLAIPLALVIAVLSIYVRPLAYTQSYQILSIAEASSDIDRIKAGQFYLTRKTAESDEAVLSEETALSGGKAPRSEQKTRSSGDRERAIFVEKISVDQALDRIFIRTRIDKELQIVSAQTGNFIERPQSSYHLLELNHARIFKRVDNGPDLFARIDHFTMNVTNEQPEPPGYKVKSIATAKLALSRKPKDRAEYQWRISTPITTLLLALLAIPLSRSRPRQGRFARLLFAFVIYAAYYNLMGVSETWVKQQVIINIWWVPLLLALVVILSYLPWRYLRFALAIRPND